MWGPLVRAPEMPRTLVAIIFVAAGCAAPAAPPVIERSVVSDAQAVDYVVSQGDTLYSIAWRFDKDYLRLARLNGIAPPYLLLPGQHLRLHGPALATRSATPSVPSDKPGRPYEPAPPRKSAPPPPARVASLPVGQWRWPTDGRVTRGFGSGSKGIDFELVPGSTVNAAAAGEVVYAGGGLRGYRSLVIIKHDPHYLSAYSLNHEITVREGQRIKLGGLLAKVARPVRLHFEIRRDGDPVNPDRLIGG